LTRLQEDLRALARSPRELWLLYVATFLEYLGVVSFLTTLPLWLTSDYNMDDKRAGWWAATFSTVLTLFVFLVGAIADSVGIRRMLIASFMLAAVTRLAMSLAPTEALAVTALLAFSFAFATSTPVLQAAVQRAADKRTRAFAFSLWYVSFNVAGAVVGPFVVDPMRRAFLDASGKLVRKTVNLPLLGPHMMSAYGAIMGIGFVFAVLAAVVTLMLRPGFEERGEGDANTKRPNPVTAMREVLSNKLFWRFVVLLGCLALVKMMFQHMHFTWPKYVLRERGDRFPVGTVWSLNSLLIVGLAPLGTLLTRHRRPFQVLLVGAFISSLSPFVLCLGETMPFQLVTIVMLTIGEALWAPRSYEYTLAIAPRGRESTYVALAALPYFLAKFLVGPTSGYLLATFCPENGARAPATLWAIVGVSTMVGPIGMFLGRRWMAQDAAQAASV
jgi:MFS family permease